MTEPKDKELDRLMREASERGELLDAILDGLSEGVLATDLKGRVLFANPAAREMLGMTKTRVKSFDEPQELPNPFSDFDLKKAVARCASEGECPEAAASVGGSRLRVRLRRLEQFDEHRGGVLAIVRDLSDSGRLEERQQRFLSVAAHELKTPLTAIIGIADLLEEEEAAPDARRRLVGHLANEARRARDLSETLLSMAGTGHDGRDPRPEAVDTLEAARAAAGRVGPLARAAGLDLRVEGAGGRVRADRGWLEQVLLAILDNAMKYSERGGAVTLRAGGDSLTVEDEGSGISEEDLPRVFDPLYRGERQNEEPRGGSRGGSRGAGLGLSVSRDLVERMGGEIFARSQPGAGATVGVKLPVAPADLR